jgi:hypothetical protein
VTPPFLSYMLEEEWVKERYYVSENDLALAKTKATKKYYYCSLLRLLI